MEIYRLSEARNAVVGEVKLEGVLAARVVLTGSRKVMKGVVEGMRRQRRRQRERHVEMEKKAKTEAEAGGVMGVAGKQDEAGEGHNENEDNDDDNDEDEQSEESEEDDEAAEKSRFDTFEKNSFRAPKFWLWWQGEQPEDRQRSDNIDNDNSRSSSVTMKGTGYIVFTGNECKAFTGTISCDEYGWDNVKFSGRKVRARAERDFALQWMVDDDDTEEEE